MKKLMIVKGFCTVKKEPMAKHDLSIKKGQTFRFEYIGFSGHHNNRIFQLVDDKGKKSYIDYKYFKQYMEYGRGKREY